MPAPRPSALAPGPAPRPLAFAPWARYRPSMPKLAFTLIQTSFSMVAVS